MPTSELSVTHVASDSVLGAVTLDIWFAQRVTSALWQVESPTPPSSPLQMQKEKGVLISTIYWTSAAHWPGTLKTFCFFSNLHKSREGRLRVFYYVVLDVNPIFDKDLKYAGTFLKIEYGNGCWAELTLKWDFFVLAESPLMKKCKSGYKSTLHYYIFVQYIRLSPKWHFSGSTLRVTN